MAAIFSGPQMYLVMFGPLAILLISSFAMRNPSPTGANLVYWSVVALIGVGMGALVAYYARIPDGMLIVEPGGLDFVFRSHHSVEPGSKIHLRSEDERVLVFAEPVQGRS